MSRSPSVDRVPPNRRAWIPTVVGALALAATVALLGLAFVFALRLDWTLAWIYAALFAATWAVAWLCLLRWNPELIRSRLYPGEGTKSWDKVWLGLFGPVTIAIFAVALLDPHGAVSSAPGPAWLLGLSIYIPSWALVIGSMVVNPFFEKTVRIQTERGHRVIDTGPYAYVRHPGYVGIAGWLLSTPLLLASPWAFVPAVLATVALVIRTALEDRTLQAELTGYPKYTERVRFRLIPGVW